VSAIDDLDFPPFPSKTKDSTNCKTGSRQISLLLLPMKPREQDNEGGEENLKGGKKKTKFNKDGDKDKWQYKDLGLMIRNPAQVPDWKIMGFHYRSIFTRELVVSTPPFNDIGLSPCNMCHVQSFCYERCDQKASHKPF
jgi:hypothetical protein